MIETLPEINQAFVKFYKTVFKDTNLSVKTKELIALSVALGLGCEPCYKTHLQKAKKAGCTDEEIREAIAVAEVVSSGRIRALAEEAGKKKRVGN